MYKLLWVGALFASIFAVISIPAAESPQTAPATTMAEARMITQLKEMATAPERANVPILEASVVLTAPRPTLASDDQLVADLGSAERLVVSADSLNLRSSPSKDADVLGRLAQGEGVEVAARKGGWVQVVTSAGVVGWASSDFLVEP